MASVIKKEEEKSEKLIAHDTDDTDECVSPVASVVKKEETCKKLTAYGSEDSDDNVRSHGYSKEGEDEEDKSQLLLVDSEKLNLGPKKKLLVFNLNGVLVHRANKVLKASFPTHRGHDGVYRSQADTKNELGLYLEGLAEAKDVPSYVKSHPFGQPAVGPAHPSWHSYSKIIRRFKN